jgi:hypothetical protein
MAARGYVVEGAVVLPPSNGATYSGSGPQPQDDDRVQQLDELKAQGLITQEEYLDKRAAIVDHGGSSTEDRLLELRALLNKKLISKREYDEKRREILDSL